MQIRIPVISAEGIPLMPTTPQRARRWIEQGKAIWGKSTQGIYQIRNSIDGKIYVGSTLNFSNRKAVHFSCLRNGKHENPYMQNAFTKHGESAFVFEILHETTGLTSEELLAIEQAYIDSTTCFDRGIGYNINPKAVLPPRSIEGCRLGGSRGGVHVGRQNVVNGTLERATQSALKWKINNHEQCIEIAKVASAKASEYWQEHPEERALQLQSAQTAAKESNSKKWIVLSPEGHEAAIVNMSQFCRDHNLDPSVMTKIAKGNPRQKTHKGWRCRYA